MTLVPLTAIVTTDLSAVTRGRSVPSDRLDGHWGAGVGWLPANLALTPFGTIVTPNAWGSKGDLRLVPDRGSRFLAETGAETPFDMIAGDIVELDGRAWPCCPRAILRSAVERLRESSGLSLKVAFEQEFQIFGADFPAAHCLSVSALRRTDPFLPKLASALDQAGLDPEVLIAEFGQDQFEASYAPADPVTAADRAVAMREITREIARCLGWRASLAPKTSPDSVGNGLHIHFSLLDGDGRPATAGGEAGGLSTSASRFCAGLLSHLPALTAFTAPSVPSFYRLRPNSWSASWTWLADRDREAALRICPVTTIAGQDPERQLNVEYRAADATANPYLALAAIIHAGTSGIEAEAAPAPVVCEHPETVDAAERERLGLRRLPETSAAALSCLEADGEAIGWFPREMLDTLTAIRRAEMAKVDDLSPEEVCALYRQLY